MFLITGTVDDDGYFGQKLPPLHIYLKRVLDKYPEGGQIIKVSLFLFYLLFILNVYTLNTIRLEYDVWRL